MERETCQLDKPIIVQKKDGAFRAQGKLGAVGTFQAAANKISYIFKCQPPSKLKGYRQSTGRNFSLSELLSAKWLPPLCVPQWHRTNIRRSYWSHQINFLFSLKLHSKSASTTTPSLGLPVRLWQMGKPSEHGRGKGTLTKSETHIQDRRLLF